MQRETQVSELLNITRLTAGADQDVIDFCHLYGSFTYVNSPNEDGFQL